MKPCSVYAWIWYSFCHFTCGKGNSQPVCHENGAAWLQSPGSSLQGFLCLPIHPDLPSLAPATEFLNLSPGKSSSLYPFRSLQPPSAPTRYIMPCSTSQLNFWASPLPFPNTMGRSTSSTNEPNRMLYSAEKDPKTAAIDLKELGMDAMLPSSVICKKKQVPPCYFNLTDNIIQPTIYPFWWLKSEAGKTRSK